MNYLSRKTDLPVISIEKSLTAAVHTAALIPFLILILDFFRNNLTAEPIQEAMHRTGRYTLILLLLTLSCTPAKILTGISGILKYRKIFGLHAFFYASLHALIFFAVDYQFDFDFIREALFEKPYALAGLFAYTLLLPLAVTSNRKSMILLRQNWKRLHRLVYVLTAAGIVHFIWLVKSDVRIPFLYAGIYIVLMFIRAAAYFMQFRDRKYTRRYSGVFSK